MRRLTFLVALIAVAAPAAFADPYTDPSIVDLRERPYLGELTRSTSFTEENADGRVMAVPQFSREELAALAGQDASEVAQFIPNVEGITVIPEPSSAALLGLGLVVLGLRRRL